MNEDPVNFAYTVELKVGERLTLPPALVDKVGPGRWATMPS
jgi:hypothetical protein